MRQSNGRTTQCKRVLELLRAWAPEWVPLPAILALGIAQYNARIYELRREGHSIDSCVEMQSNGQRRSWFRLVLSRD